MKVSLRIVEKLAGFALPSVDEVVARVNARLGGVEDVIDLGAKYKDVRVVRVVSSERHPDADRLSVTKIDDGGMVEDVPRDEHGLVQVVCGAPNVRADMWALWLPPKATVPATFDDAEPFVLSARPLRGVLSQGMLAAADELAIGDDHEGIIVITEDDVPAGATLQPGASFADMFGLSGHVIDIENKMFTHRPDCFGQLGVAREIAGIFGQQFTSPDWYTPTQEYADSEGLELTVVNDAADVVPRFMAVAIDDVEVKPSPLWLQCQLVAMGAKPINSIVDATNYVMLMTAQPTHAYDYDKVRGGTLTARMARQGEELTLLNGKTCTLNEKDIVIADAERVIGLAGIMGGRDTEVTNETKRIILECATFDMYAVRKTAMRHGVFTDALARFNKGQSSLQTAPVLSELMRIIGGRQVSVVWDVGCSTEARDSVRVSRQFVNERLGTEFTAEDMQSLLAKVECVTEIVGDEVMVQPPFWRTDIVLPEDVVEEIGRLYGFDALPRELPHRNTKPAPKNTRRELKKLVRESLSRAGANEVTTYSFVHERTLQKAGQDATRAFKLSNALSPDLQYYRLTVLPSLLDKVHGNIKAGYDTFALFEIGKGHDKEYRDFDGLPREKAMVDMVYATKTSQMGAPFYAMRRLVQQLCDDLGVSVKYVPLETEHAPFERMRSAAVCTDDGTVLGVVGEFAQSVQRDYKLPEGSAGATIDIEALESVYDPHAVSYVPLAKFPQTSRDISLKVASETAYDAVVDIVKQSVQSAGDVRTTVSPVAIYQAKDDAAHKTITLHLTFRSDARTLTDAEIAPIMLKIFRDAHEKCAAECA